MKLHVLKVAVVTAVFGLAGVSHAESSKQVLDGVTVWKVPAVKQELVGFKAQVDLQASVNTVLATILDTDNANEWIPNTGRIDVIDRSQLTKGKAKLYYLIDMPFPMADRDLVLESRIVKESNGSVRVDNVLTKDSRFPENPNIVRIKTYEGGWLLQPLGPNSTRVTLEGRADPGGAIPVWATNLFVTKQPSDMLKNMREQVKKKRYSKPNLPFDFTAP